MVSLNKMNLTFKVCPTPASQHKFSARNQIHLCPHHMNVSHFLLSFFFLSSTPVSAVPSQVRWHVDPIYELGSCCDRQSICDLQPHHICHNTSQIQVGCRLKVLNFINHISINRAEITLCWIYHLCRLLLNTQECFFSIPFKFAEVPKQLGSAI